MERKYRKINTPLKVGGVTLKNRIISAPMTYPILTVDGCLTPEAIAFYELRAKGGAGVVTVSELIVDGATGKYYPIQVLGDAVNAKDSLAMAARAVKRHGAIASMELSHGGRFSITEGIALGPSDEYEDGEMTARAMTREEISRIIESYAKAAALCRDAGFEMLLIHAGHGWLLEQFLSPSGNRRTDEYGGRLENRARLTLEVLTAIRGEVGRDFPLELRMSAQEYIDGGYTFEEAVRFAQMVEEKIDLLQVSTGSHKDSFYKTHPSMFSPRGVNVHYAREIRKKVKIPVATIGGLGEPEQLEEIIATGAADAVVMARALLADPYLPRKACEGRDDEIVRCCRCFACMAERMTTGLRICAVNPEIGSEYEHKFMPAVTKRKKVLIAGGGPGGMQCAVTAAERGHKVILCEKSGELGGALKSEREIPFKSDLYRFIEVKARQMEKAGVDIRLNTEVTEELVTEQAPEALIIAVGAEPIIPEIPGISGANVKTVDKLPEGYGRAGERIVIIGGGLVGCETAVHLAMKGCAVTVIEKEEELCRDANARHRPILLEKLNEGVKQIRSARVTKVTETGVICERGGEEIYVEGESVICAVGQKPLRAVVEKLRDTAPYVDIIGDCVKPQNAANAVFRGHFAAIDI